jgi:hypothetical protein
MSGRDRRERQSRRRGGASGRGNLLAFFLLGSAAISVGGILAAKSILSPAKGSWDQATLCPSTGPTAVHVVLVDRSDPITPLQAQRVRQVMNRIIEDAQPGERIDLYVADGDGREALAPRVSLCNPGREGNALYQNPRRIRERYETSFKVPVEATMASMLEPAGRGSSPIVESIKSVCVGAFGSLPQGRTTRVTLVSDMLQHSSLISHFRERDFEAFARSPRLALGLADCRSAQFSVLYLLRPEHRRIQDRGHQLFWEKLIDRNNARLIRVEAI